MRELQAAAFGRRLKLRESAVVRVNVVGKSPGRGSPASSGLGRKVKRSRRGAA